MLFRSKFAFYAAFIMMAMHPSSMHATTVQMNILPASGVLTVGAPLQIQITLSDLDPANSLYAFTFDLGFDPAVLQAKSALDGTIFGAGAFYSTGTIDNAFGTITLQAGLDVNQTFQGTGGLIGTFLFMPIGPAMGTAISVQNVALQTFDGAMSGQADIDPGTLPTAIFDVTAVPEPATVVLLAGGLLILAGVMRRKRILFDG